MRALIIVKDLVKRYGDKAEVLNGLNFSVEPGDFVAVYGQSGCGKTTLLSVLGGLDRPTSGLVIINDENIVGLDENDIAKFRLMNIGFVFQDYNLLEDLTVEQNVELPLTLSGKADGGRVEYLLKTFGIDHIAKDTANKISGGEAQRAAVARAMANEPKIILADEPTGNLDEENAENVMAMFQVVRREFGTTVVLATHDQDIARQANRAMRLGGGRIREISD